MKQLSFSIQLASYIWNGLLRELAPWPVSSRLQNRVLFHFYVKLKLVVLKTVFAAFCSGHVKKRRILGIQYNTEELEQKCAHN